jgi:hypothetical protein
VTIPDPRPEEPFTAPSTQPRMGPCEEIEHEILTALLSRAFWNRRWLISPDDPAHPDVSGPDVVAALNSCGEVVFRDDQWNDALRRIARIAVDAFARRWVEQLNDLAAYQATYGPAPRAARRPRHRGPHHDVGMGRVMSFLNEQFREGAPIRDNPTPVLFEIGGTLVKLLHHTQHPDTIDWAREALISLARLWYPEGSGVQFEADMFPELVAQAQAMGRPPQ